MNNHLEKRTFNATDRDDSQWQIEARFVDNNCYEACLYRLSHGRPCGEPVWTKYIIGAEIDLRNIMADYLADANAVADAFLEGAQ